MRPRLALSALLLLGACARGAVEDAPAQPGAAAGPAAGASSRPAAGVAETWQGSVVGSEPKVLPSSTTRSGGWQHFGTTFELPPEAAVDCAAVLADLPAHVGGPLRLAGWVQHVCQVDGCWLALGPEGGSPQLQVTTRDQAFHFGKDGLGRQAEVEGQLVAGPPPGAVAAHLPAQEGATAAYHFVASAVRVRNP